MTSKILTVMTEVSLGLMIFINSINSALICFHKSRPKRILLKRGVRMSGILKSGVPIFKKMSIFGSELGVKTYFLVKNCMILK